MAPDIALKLSLAPLLLAQGLAVRRRALVLPEPPGAREGITGDGPPLRLLIVGDSSAAGVGAPDQASALAGQLVTRLATTHRVTWRLIARTGATTAQTLTRLQGAPPARYDIAVTALGVNDVTRSIPLSRWLGQQDRLLDRLTGAFGARHVVVSGLPPMGDFPALPQPLRRVMGLTAQRYDTALARTLAPRATASHVAFEMPLTRALMANDGFHPGPEGYAAWAEALEAAIRAAL